MVYTLTVHLYANEKPDSIGRIKAKLIEAARIYRKDKETIDWLVMQDVHDPRAFTIVERFENEGVCSAVFTPLLPMHHLTNYLSTEPEIPP
jgi:quinol monooxygenase YgiN